MVRLMAQALCIVLLCSILAIITPAQRIGPDSPSAPPVATAQASSQPFNVNSAVEFYLAKMPPAERARSNSYFEGGYWFQLWDFLSTVLLMLLLLQFGWSRRMRDLSERITRLRPLQTGLYWLQFI